MAYFLFVDESGQDQQESPYEVLAGITVEDKKLWPLILDLQKTEIEVFGRRYSADISELKAKKILKKKTFNLASRCAPMMHDERRTLSAECLSDGASATPKHLAALAQSKMLFVRKILNLCKQYDCHVFASVVATHERNYNKNFLRKDYSYLFERYYYYLEDHSADHCGIIVFDELEKSRSHLLVEQLALYFKETARGRERAVKIVPEPLFVHSDLTTGVQLADLAAYMLSWGFRTGVLTKPARAELRPYVERLASLRYKTSRIIQRKGVLDIWSIAIIEDLRARDDRIDDLSA